MFASLRFRIVALGGCCLAALLVSMPADAATTTVAALGVLDGDRLHKRLSTVLQESLPEGQHRDLPLTPAEQRCQEAECLQDLGERLGVDLLIAGTVQTGMRRGLRQYTLTLLLFDVQRGGSNTRSLVRSSESELVAELPEAIDALLQANSQPRPFPRAESVSLAVAEEPSGPLAHSPRPRPWRTALVGGLGALGVLSLTTAVVAHALHGRQTAGVCDDLPGLKQPHNTVCLFQTAPVFTSGYVVAAGSLIGLVLTVALP